MATTVHSHCYHLRHGKLIDIDAIEHEDDAVFSDDEYFSADEGDEGVDESVSMSQPSADGGVAIGSHLVFLAGAIPSYPANGVPPPGQSADDEEDEYEPDPTGVADVAKFGAAIPTEHVVVDVEKLHRDLSIVAGKAFQEREVRVAALEAKEAEFSDGSDQEKSDEGMEEEVDESPNNQLRLLAQDVIMEDDDDDEYTP